MLPYLIKSQLDKCKQHACLTGSMKRRALKKQNMFSFDHTKEIKGYYMWSTKKPAIHSTKHRPGI